MVLLGMTAPFLGILTPEALREAVARVFAPKGEAVVEADLLAFDLGLQAALK
jgi:indolepyruvate ferredoxin oxidoreductase beta subunit